MMVRLAISALLTVALSACDTMIADRWVIQGPAKLPSGEAIPAPSAQDVLTDTRVAIDDCGLGGGKIMSDQDTLAWRDPNRPPGFHVMVHAGGDGLKVTLAQDLYGPIGPTDAYSCVKKTLRKRLEQRYGTEGVRVDS